MRLWRSIAVDSFGITHTFPKNDTRRAWKEVGSKPAQIPGWSKGERKKAVLATIGAVSESGVVFPVYGGIGKYEGEVATLFQV
jgi:hypothetical protein